MTYAGAKLVWLEGGGRSYRAGETIPAGQYSAMAMFDGEASAVQAGKITIIAGKEATLKCVRSFKTCKVN